MYVNSDLGVLNYWKVIKMRTLVFSDLHGQYGLWKQIERFIQPDDKVYCLGDCADRGPDGWKIIKEVLNTPNITYIRGNHEQFIIDEDYSLWRYNGGDPTINASDLDTDKNWDMVRRKLMDTPLIVNYTNNKGIDIALCHAGFDPKIIQYQDDYDLIWDRRHLERSWPEGWDNLIVIHGHTPIPYILDYVGVDEKPPKENRAYWYCDWHKCCIDMLSFQTKKAIVLDLNTFEEYLFEEK